VLKAATASPSNQQPELPQSGEAQPPLEVTTKLITSVQPILSLQEGAVDVEVPLPASNELPLAGAAPVADAVTTVGAESVADASAFAHLVAQIEPAPPALFTVPGLARYQRLERVVNVVLASVALLVSMPALFLIAIAVRLTSPGPIFYRQPRIGLNRRGVRLHNRRRLDRRWHLWARFLEQHDDQRSRDLGGSAFMIYKFRTMREDAETQTGAVWATKNDPRSTVIGGFLRKYRLDELPQLINVIQGDMNLVGPRPERPTIFAQLSEQIEEYPLRQRVKPGITGWAQIHLTYDSCIEDVRKKVRYDLEYLRQKSIRRDLAIMLKTLPSVLFKKRGW
jgi:lipopolysaccharide/colanic/teichoic acid biosynthesis glycosyltransferase